MSKGIDQMRKGTTVMVILNLLEEAGEPLHGYEMIRRLEESSQGLFQFKEGLVYPALHRMEQEGLISSRWTGEAGSRRRKVYTLTEKGHARLVQDVRRWRALSQGVDRLLGLRGL
jgi:DNA-binding PadR family transcriptional regulator